MIRDGEAGAHNHTMSKKASPTETEAIDLSAIDDDEHHQLQLLMQMQRPSSPHDTKDTAIVIDSSDEDDNDAVEFVSVSRAQLKAPPNPLAAAPAFAAAAGVQRQSPSFSMGAAAMGGSAAAHSAATPPSRAMDISSDGASFNAFCRVLSK